MRLLDTALGHPHKSFRSVHVGGTNGKGSVATKIAAALQAEGYKVGLYTSPHIRDVRERIRINGAMIGEEEAEAILERLFALGTDLSFFDWLTMLAFVYFKEQKVDWAVIEVGLGGRLDATNIITPEIAVITSIGFDHVHLLGATLEEIAREKGGIAKSGIPLVTGPSAAPFFPGAITVPSAPFFDQENSAIARAVLEKLSISLRSIERGLQARPRCRFEVMGNCVFDVAHNPDGFRKLLEALRLYFPGERWHFIVAFSKDKDWRACLDLIRPAASRITALKTGKERLEKPEVLQAHAPDIEIAGSIAEAVQEGMLNVISGSFYIMDSAALSQPGEYNNPHRKALQACRQEGAFPA